MQIRNQNLLKKIYQVHCTSPEFKNLFNNLKKAFKTVKLVF